jgi:hypothetical protein
MRKIHIDFAPPGLRRTLFHTPRAAWGLLWLCLCAAMLLLSNGMHYRRQLVDHAAQAERMRAHERAMAATARADKSLLPAGPAPAPVPAARAAAVNAVILRLNVPWRALRDAVQNVTPAGVGLLALAPDANRRSVRITAEAKDSAAMLGYVAELERGGWFRAVRLARHEIDEGRPERPLRFEVDAVWSGDAP